MHSNKKHLNIINLYSISDSKLVFNQKNTTLQHNSYISSWCPKCNHNFRPIPGEVTHSCFPSSGQQFNRLGSLAPQTTCQLDILKIPSEICLLKFPNFYHICREIMVIYICIYNMYIQMCLHIVECYQLGLLTTWTCTNLMWATRILRSHCTACIGQILIMPCYGIPCFWSNFDFSPLFLFNFIFWPLSV